MAFKLTPRLINGAYVFQCGMIIDADGANGASTSAYRPDNQGLDVNSDAEGKDGKLVGIVTINGKPYITKDGNYLSCSALQDHTKAATDPTRYVDAAFVPYYTICPELKTSRASGGPFNLGGPPMQLGDCAYVLRQDAETGLICADVCPPRHFGECSVAAAPGVKLSGSPLNGGCDAGCTYVLFPGTASDPAWPRTVVDFQLAAQAAFAAFGGRAALIKAGLTL